MAGDGISLTQRLDGTTERKLHAKVVDNILNAPAYLSRLMAMGKPFEGKSQDFTVDVSNSTQFEWFTGLENLNASAENTTITLTYYHTAGTQPKVSIMLESFANAGQTGTIPLDAFLYEKAAQEAIRNVATAAYSTGTGDRPLGLQAIVDDGTNKATIGGQTRSAYDPLDCAAHTDSGGTMTLAKLGVLDDACSASGVVNATPNINDTTKTVWSLYEQLLQPQARASYNEIGYKMLPQIGDRIVTAGNLKGAAGFTALQHRGAPLIKDDFATTGVWYKLNERSFGWYGRSIVPDEYKGLVTKVNLGSMEAYESRATENTLSEFNGWFYQKPMMMPDQAGTIARFYVIGQMMTWEPRRNGQLHDITGV